MKNLFCIACITTIIYYLSLIKFLTGHPLPQDSYGFISGLHLIATLPLLFIIFPLAVIYRLVERAPLRKSLHNNIGVVGFILYFSCYFFLLVYLLFKS